MRISKYIWVISFIFVCFISKSFAQTPKEMEEIEKYSKQRDESDRCISKDMDEYDKSNFKNILQVINCYTKTANSGNIYSQYRLGRMYADNEYIPADYVEAMKWFVKAADQGDRMANISLAFMYKDGRKGIAKDKIKVDKYAKKACEDINYLTSAALHPDSLTGQCLMYNDFKGLDKKSHF